MVETNNKEWMALSKVSLDNDPFDQTISITCSDFNHIEYGLNQGNFTVTYKDETMIESHEVFLGSEYTLDENHIEYHGNTMVIPYEEM